MIETKINKDELLKIINEWNLINVNEIIINYDDEISIIELFELFDIITEKSQFWINNTIKPEDLLSLFDNVLNTFELYEKTSS